MADTKLLEKVPIVMLGDIALVPGRSLIAYLSNHPNVKRIPYPSAWDGELDMAREIASMLQKA